MAWVERRRIYKTRISILRAAFSLFFALLMTLTLQFVNAIAELKRHKPFPAIITILKQNDLTSRLIKKFTEKCAEG